MVTSSEPDPDCDRRIIDRSGDIDQRPPEERGGSGRSIVLLDSTRASPISYAQMCETPGAPVKLQRICSPVTSEPASQRPHKQGADLSAIAGQLQNRLDSEIADAKAKLGSIVRKIEAQERKCVAPKVDDELQQIKFQRQKILVTHGPGLADCLREEKSRLRDLEGFRTENNLTRDADYPKSRTLALGVLAVLVLVEAGINGVFFADSSDQGLLGGWIEAFVLALTNVGSAFLLGRLVFPQLHRLSIMARFAGSAATLAGVASLIAVNLFGAHYRDFKAEAVRAELAAPAHGDNSLPAPKTHVSVNRIPGTPAGADKRPASGGQASGAIAIASPRQDSLAPVSQNEKSAVASVLSAPLKVESFTSFFLLVIGLCGATVAALDGYKLDDPFPGYGRRHRRYAEARAESAAALRRILNHCNAVVSGSFQSLNRKIEAYAAEVAVLQTLHHAQAGEAIALKANIESAARKAEEEFEWQSRLLNKRSSVAAGECMAFSTRDLTSLNEKHIKFRESQERKLSALQKSVSKEQNAILDVFETASADFQHLLNDASQASLASAMCELRSPG